MSKIADLVADVEKTEVTIGQSLAIAKLLDASVNRGRDATTEEGYADHVGMLAIALGQDAEAIAKLGGTITELPALSLRIAKWGGFAVGEAEPVATEAAASAPSTPSMEPSPPAADTPRRKSPK